MRMSNVLDKICDDKRVHIAACKAATSLSELEARAKDAGPTRGFARALSERAAAGRFGLIAEIKKASPSKGLIRADFERGTAFFIAPAGHDRRHPERFCQHDRHRSDPAGPAMHQQGLARLGAAALEDIVPDGKQGFGQGRRFL